MKQTLAPALDLNRREQLLRQVFRYLKLPEAPETDRPAELLDWAVALGYGQSAETRHYHPKPAPDKRTNAV